MQSRPAVLPFHARLVCVLVLACCASTATAQLQDIRGRAYTQGELALLPEWCIDSQDGPYGSPEGADWMNKSPRARTWVSLMGQDFWHMHHYCRGLRDTLRLQRAGLSVLDRNFLMQRAINEFFYIINNCAPTMPLMPEVYVKLGEVYLLQKNLGAAQAAFEQSRRLKPDYWPAYDRWVEVLIDLKQWEPARRLTQEGLALMPGEPNLSSLLRRIETATGRMSTPLATPAADRAATTDKAQAASLR